MTYGKFKKRMKTYISENLHKWQQVVSAQFYVAELETGNFW